MKQIFAQNNFIFLNEFDLNQTIITFCPKYYSENQKSFYYKRFLELSHIAPNINWPEEVNVSKAEVVLSWDALFENKTFGSKIYTKQNRLFSHLPFNLPESFTPFRILAEKHLPKMYHNPITPWDHEIKNEIVYYFQTKKLPLTYLETRNQMIGRDGSTKFSAYLSSGFLDVKYLYNQVRIFESIHGATKSTGWIIFELLWREFFYWHYQKYPRHYFSKNGLKSLDFNKTPKISFEDLKNLEAHPFFYAALNELVSTGYLSNRARQIFASIWINDLKMDWRLGAELFERYLIDYDVYSNYGNWMYLAGVGVDPRGQRYFNVQKQLEMYDVDNAYLKMWEKF